MVENQGIELLRQTVRSIKGGHHQGVIAISKYTLEEALNMERKVLEWAQKHGYELVEGEYDKIDNSEHFSRIHIYLHYLKPRIEELQTLKNVEEILLTPTEATPKQLSLK